MFDWDADNLREIRAHRIKAEEVEIALSNDPIPIYEQNVEGEVRYVYYGETNSRWGHGATPGSFDRIAKGLHAFFEHRLRSQLATAAKDEGAEILVPVAIGCNRFGLNPVLKRQQVRNGNPALFDAFQQMAPYGSWKVRELKLRQSSPSRRLRESSLCPLRSYAQDRFR